MNKLQQLAAAISLIAVSSSASAVILNSNDTFVYAFNSLPSVEYLGYQNQGGATIHFSGDLLDIGDVVRLELFEDSLLGPVIFSNDFNSPTEHFGVTRINTWQDLQGVIRLTVLSGSVGLSSIDLQVFKDGYRYADSYTTTAAVPEPETYAMMLAGLGLMGFVSYRRKQKQAGCQIGWDKGQVI